MPYPSRTRVLLIGSGAAPVESALSQCGGYVFARTDDRRAGLEEIRSGRHDVCVLAPAGAEDRDLFEAQIPVIVLTDRNTAVGQPIGGLHPAADCLDSEEITPLFLERSIRYAIDRFRLRNELRSCKAGGEKLKFLQEAVLDNIPDLVWHKDARGRYVAANEAFLELCGVDREKLIGKTDPEIWPPDLAKICMAGDSQVMSSAKRQCFEKSLVDKTGRQQWIEAIKSPVFGPAGEAIGITGTARDITRRKRAEKALSESETRYRTLFEGSMDAIFLHLDHRSGGAVQDCNSTASRLFGYTKEELLGLRIADLIAPEAVHTFPGDEIAHGVLGKALVKRKDGLVFPVEISATQVTIADKTFVLSYLRDISKRVRAQKSLEASIARYQGLFRYAPNVLLEYDLSAMKEHLARLKAEVGEEFHAVVKDNPEVAAECIARAKATDLNEAALRMFQAQSAGDYISNHVNIWCGDKPNGLLEAMIAVLEGQASFETEATARTLRDEKVRLEVKCAVAPGYEKEASKVFVCAGDVTERKHSEEALQAAHRRLQDIINFLPDATFVIDREGRIVTWNRAIEEMTGVGAADMLGKGNFEYAVPFYGKRRPILIDLVFEPDEEVQNHYSVIRQEKDVLIAQTGHTMVRDKHLVLWGKASPIYDRTGNVVGAIESIRDITEQKRSEQALRRSQRELSIRHKIAHIFLEKPDDEMFGAVLDEVLAVFESEYGIFGYIDENGNLVAPSMRGQVLEECRITQKDTVFPRGSWGGLWGQALKTRKSCRKDAPGQVPEGHIPIKRALCTPVVHSGKSIGLIAIANKETPYTDGDAGSLESIAENISPILHARLQRDKEERDRKSIEKQLRQAQKMEAIGTMAGGIAHDFNNILAALMGYTEMTIEAVPGDSFAHANLEQILKGIQRARDLVRQILIFSRKSEQEKKPIPITSLVKEVLKLLRASLPTTIEIRQEIHIPPESQIMADPSQVHQVLMNLCANATQAMREKGGILTVGLDDPDPGFMASDASPETGHRRYFRITVSDTGQGMHADTLERIFDPFFTTRSQGEGTGLGLSVVHGIIREHGGEIQVISHPGQGSTFHVFFPRHDRPLSEVPGSSATIHKGEGRILFVDDEEDLVLLGRQMLESLGYQAVTTTSSGEAYELLTKRAREFDLLITDYTMPTMTGIALARKVKEVRPDIPIILCTGYRDAISEARATTSGISQFLAKPYGRREIAEAIEKALDTASSGHERPKAMSADIAAGGDVQPPRFPSQAMDHRSRQTGRGETSFPRATPADGLQSDAATRATSFSD